VLLAGQITGVEGYVESCAAGFVCAVMLAQALLGRDVVPPPATTALGGVLTHLARATQNYQPSNVTWAWLPPLPDRRLKKHDRYEAMARRALDDLARWMQDAPLARAA
jgi:methylenetetrahydrofolate--tRNA-(uracil-5-)-methyltransferase